MSTKPVAASSFGVCPVCGCRAEYGEQRCAKCGRRLITTEPTKAEPSTANRDSRLHVLNPQQKQTGRAPVLLALPPKAPAFPEPLRRQLSAQVQEFRARRRPSLPFPVEEAPQEGEHVNPANEAAPTAERKLEHKIEGQIGEKTGGKIGEKTETRAAESQARYPRTTQPQSPLAFPEPSGRALHFEFSTPPVASFRARLLSDSLDFALIALGVALCLAPLPLLAGEVVWNRYVAAGSFAIVCLVALLYGLIFVYLAGTTPAMRRMGLRLVNFDGQPASRPERLWRLLGTVASAGSFLLGFVWAAMDDERFSWHDRISRTFLTSDHSVFTSDHSAALPPSHPRKR